MTRITVPELVSVIIPTYGHGHTILETLESVFRQTYQNFEVIVVNDGSPDDTGSVIQTLVDQGRILYVEQENRGQSVARNRGLKEASGELIAFLDDDDLWPKDKLEWQVRVMQEDNECVMVYGGMRPFTGEMSSELLEEVEVCSEAGISGIVHEQFLKRNWIVSPGQTLVRSRRLFEVGGLNEQIWGADDYDLYLRLARLGPFRYVHRISLFYRKHGGNASRRIGQLYRNMRKVRRAHRTLNNLLDRDYWEGEMFMRRFYSRQFAVLRDSERLKGNKLRVLLAGFKAAWIWPPSLLPKCLRNVDKKD